MSFSLSSILNCSQQNSKFKSASRYSSLTVLFSARLTEAIRKMDMYRYGIIGETRLDFEEFKAFMKDSVGKFTATEISILNDRYFGSF